MANRKKPRVCKIKLNQLTGELDFISDKLGEGLTRTEIIEGDKQYGQMTPRNGEYFVYQILNHDVEVTARQVRKMVKFAHRQVEIRCPIKFRRGDLPDFRISFRSTAEDPTLDKNTLMYHYYPINQITHELRGLCVVNKDYYWTADGKPIPMYEIDPDNYSKDSATTGKTYDFDQVYTHELLHGLGLPHSPNIYQVMSPNYSIMAEFLTEEDVERIQAKYGEREMSIGHLQRWLNWLFHRSDD